MKHWFKQHPHWLLIFLAIGIFAFYQAIWATDRYVSEANVVLESPQISLPSFDVTALLGGSGGASGDMLLGALVDVGLPLQDLEAALWVHGGTDFLHDKT
mgnify:CR=1 FL=1